MEIYIGDLRLPVVEPTFKIEEIHDNKEEQVVGFGGVNLIGKRALKTFNYSSFYPKRYDSSYCNFSNLLNPMTFVRKILEYKNNINKVRLVIPKMDINSLYTIDSFSYNPNDGTDDIFYSISMKEFRLPVMPTTNYTYEVYNLQYAKEDKMIVGQNYTVKEGDTIVTIARKFNMVVADLYNDNIETIGTNPTNIKVGMKLWIRGSK